MYSTNTGKTKLLQWVMSEIKGFYNLSFFCAPKQRPTAFPPFFILPVLHFSSYRFEKAQTSPLEIDARQKPQIFFFHTGGLLHGSDFDRQLIYLWFCPLDSPKGTEWVWKNVLANQGNNSSSSSNCKGINFESFCGEPRRKTNFSPHPPVAGVG